jgi:Tol biopolymer transport system component
LAFGHRGWKVGLRIGPLAVLACAAGLIALAVPAQAAFPGDNGKIAFSSNISGNYEVYSINADGTGLTNLTNNPASDGQPAWSADGTKLAFVRYDPSTQESAVWRMNANGSGQAPVVNFGAQPGYVSHPAWSPDGGKIVFGGAQRVGQAVTDERIWVVNSDGSGLIWILWEDSIGYVPHSPDWSPDGQKIAFYGGAHLTQGVVLATSNPDGSGATKISPCIDDFARDFDPDWSPDSSKVLFVALDHTTDFGCPPYPNGLLTMNRDGSGTSVVKNTSGNVAAPVWSPDQTKVLFAQSGTGGGLRTINVDGTGEVPVPNTAGGLNPDWQPLRPPGYARPKLATPTTYRLVPAYEPCMSSNGTHGAPLALPSCNPPQLSSHYLTIGTSDSNGRQTNFTGLVTTRTLTESPIDLANGDQSDLEFTTQLADIRQEQTLADYGGEVRVSFALRLTDRSNGPGAVHPATVTDTIFGYTVPCVTNDNAQIGSSCNSTTTADAVMPGIALEQRRAVWQLGPIQLYDGGADRDADTPGDNTLFATQGLFAP